MIVPVFDRTRYLAQCLGSVLAQDLPAEEVEILVVDDAGPHDLAPLLRGIGGGRVGLLRNARNMGLYPSVNAAIPQSAGRWVHVLHDDDWLEPGFHAALRAAEARAAPGTGVLLGHYANVEEGSGRSWSPPPFSPAPGPLGEAFLARLAMANPLQVPAVVIRRETFGLAGPFREDLPYTADWEWYLRAMLKVGWHYEPAARACFRLHAENQSKALARRGRTAEDIRRTLDIFARLLPAELAARLLPRARRGHAENCLRSARHLLARGEGALAGRFMAEACALDPRHVLASLAPPPQA